MLQTHFTGWNRYESIHKGINDAQRRISQLNSQESDELSIRTVKSMKDHFLMEGKMAKGNTPTPTAMYMMVCSTRIGDLAWVR